REPRLEEAQLRRLVDHLEPGHELPALVHLADDAGDVVEVLPGVHAPRDRQADELEAVVRLVSVLTGDDPPLHRADAAGEVERGGERLSRILDLREMRQEALRVEEDRVGADGDDDRDPALLQDVPEICALPDVVADERLVGRLADPLRERLHVVAGEPAVVRKALVDDDQLARALAESVVIRAITSGSVSSAYPRSRSLTKSAFSEIRVASSTSETSDARVSSRTAARFSIENGCPPAMLRHASTRTKATRSGAAAASTDSSAARSTFPLKGYVDSG